MDLGEWKMTQLNIKHPSGVGQFVGLGQFFCLCGDRRSFSSKFLRRFELSGLVMLGKKAILKAWSAWSSFQLWCEPSRRCVRAQCDKKRAVESCSRHHPQISSPTHWKDREWRSIFHRFGHSARSGLEYFVFAPGQRKLVSLYGNSGAPPRALSTRRFPCPQSFLTHFCALCLRALLTTPQS